MQGRPRAAGPPHAPYHPLKALWAFRGPLRCTGLGTSLRACWLGTPRYTHPYTHPGYPPGPHTTPSAGHAQYGWHAQNSCFRPVVGEPRGIETSLFIGSQAGLYTL